VILEGLADITGDVLVKCSLARIAAWLSTWHVPRCCISSRNNGIGGLLLDVTGYMLVSALALPDNLAIVLLTNGIDRYC
jgi:hypothetical protein